MVRKCTRGRAPLPLPAGGGRAALQVLPLHAKEVPCAVKGVRPRADRSRYARAWDGAVFRGASEQHGHENRKARRWRAGKAHWRKMRSSPRLTLVPNLGGEESAVERHLHQLVDQEITRTCGGGNKHKSPSSVAARFLHRFDKKSQSMGLGCQRREGAGTRSAR